MKIESVLIKSDDRMRREEDTQVATVVVTGAIDKNNAVVKRARELVLRTRSREALASFDAAIEQGLFRSDR